MADNTYITPGSGESIASDDVDGVKYQRVKLSVGPDGVAADVHAGNPLPVGDAGGSLTVDGTVTVEDGGGSLTVDGEVTVNGTVAAAQSGEWNVAHVGAVAAPVTVVDGGSSLTVDGTVTVDDGGASLTVDGAVTVDDGGDSLTVDGTVAVTQGSAWVVSGVTDPVTVEDGGGSLTVDGAVSVDDGGGSLTVDGVVTVEGAVAITEPLPAGTNKLGTVEIDTSLPAGESHLGEVGGKLVRVAVELTRPANTTAYAANDAVNNSAATPALLHFANVVRVAGGSAYLVRAAVATDRKSITPRLRVHLFNASDPTISADNLPWQDRYADLAKRMGYFDLPALTTAADTANSDMSRSQDNNLRLPVVCAPASRDLWVGLETLDSFTPNSGQKFTLVLFFDIN